MQKTIKELAYKWLKKERKKMEKGLIQGYREDTKHITIKRPTS